METTITQVNFMAQILSSSEVTKEKNEVKDSTLLNTKIWINKDEALLRQIEEQAFKQGFGWLVDRYNPNTGKYVQTVSFKHTQLKNVFALYFLESNKGNRSMCYKLNYRKSVTKDWTHKNRFDSYKYNTECSNCSGVKKKELREITIKDLKPTYKLWKLKIAQ